MRPVVHRFAAWLPLATINLCYVVAVVADHVPACFPYLAGCTSTSSAGRSAPESLLFRAGMIPAAVAIALFWHRCAEFLDTMRQPGLTGPTLRRLGELTAVALVLYTVTLGLERPPYPALRHLGIDGFFLANFVAQVVFIVAARRAIDPGARPAWRVLAGICIAIPAAAISGEVAKLVGLPKHPVNNIVEWNGIVAICAWYLVVGRIWRRHGFAVNFSASRSSGQAASPRE